jgi:hypothetical protein
MLVTALEFVEHEVAVVGATGSPDFPEIRHHHSFEVGPGGSELKSMEDWFAGDELSKDALQFRVVVRAGSVLAITEFRERSSC